MKNFKNLIVFTLNFSPTLFASKGENWEYPKSKTTVLQPHEETSPSKAKKYFHKAREYGNTAAKVIVGTPVAATGAVVGGTLGIPLIPAGAALRAVFGTGGLFDNKRSHPIKDAITFGALTPPTCAVAGAYTGWKAVAKTIDKVSDGLDDVEDFLIP